MKLLHLAPITALVLNVNSIPVDIESGSGYGLVGADPHQKILGPSDHVEISAVPVGQIITQCTVPGTFALTFDDGPYTYTDKILDILRANGVKATFFVNGQNFGNINDPVNQARVRRAINEGHQIGSHTYLSLLFPLISFRLFPRATFLSLSNIANHIGS